MDEAHRSGTSARPLWSGCLAAIALLVAMVLGRSGHVRAAFDFGPREASRWTAAEGIAELTVRDGRLLVVPANRDARLRLAASFPARPVRWISMRARFVVEPGWVRPPDESGYESDRHELTLSWTRTADSPRPGDETFLVEEGVFDGAPHTYEFPVGEQSGWSGTITSVDLALLDVRAPACRIEIDRIAFLGHRPTVLGSWTVLGVIVAGWTVLALLLRGGRRAGRVLLAILAPATAVFLLEVALNCVGFERPVESVVVRVLANEVEMAGFRGFFRYDPDCLFTQKPGVGYRAGESINREGLRGPLPAAPRPDGTLRVASFGDSSTFGLGLPVDESYPARLAVELERLLSARDGGGARSVEPINAGVIGSTVVQGRRIYRHHVRRYRPDVVTLAYGAINEHYPTVLSDLDRLAVARRVPRWAYESREWLLPRSKTAQLLAALLDRQTDLGLPADWLESSTRRVAPAEFAQELRGFIEDARADGAGVVLVSMPRGPGVEDDLPILVDYTRAIETVAAEAAAPLVDLRSRLGEFPEGDGSYFMDSIHPSARGAAWIARTLAPAVLEVLPREGGATADPPR